MENKIENLLIDYFYIAWNDKVFDHSPHLEDKIKPLKIYKMFEDYLFGTELNLSFDDFYVQLMIEHENNINYMEIEDWFYNKVKQYLNEIPLDNFNYFNTFHDTIIGVTDLPITVDEQGIRNNQQEILDTLCPASDLEIKDLEIQLADSLPLIFETDLIDYYSFNIDHIVDTLYDYSLSNYYEWVLDFIDDFIRN